MLNLQLPKLMEHLQCSKLEIDDQPNVRFGSEADIRPNSLERIFLFHLY